MTDSAGGGTTTEPYFRENNKTGTVGTTTAAIFCAVVGSGVLNLPQCVAWMGWIAGPLTLIIFYLISLMTSRMLARCYVYKNLEHSRYHHCVRNVLGVKNAIAVSFFQLLHICLVITAYTITGAAAIVQIAQLSCSYSGGDLGSISCLAPSQGGDWVAALTFGGAQLFLSQFKNIEEIWWMSYLGTVGSLLYGFLALGLALSEVSNGYGDVGGIPVGYNSTTTGYVTQADKAFGILTSLGAIAFAYSFALILLEIQDTLHQPPSAVQSMTKSINFAITGSFALYIGVAVTGYAAVGNSVAGLVFESLPGPDWLIMIGFIAILLHMLTAFQLFAHALFNSIESHVKFSLLKRAAAREEKQLVQKQKELDAAMAATATTGDVEGGQTTAAASGGSGSYVSSTLQQSPTPSMPTPFDAPSPIDSHTQHDHHKNGEETLGFYHVKLEPVAQRLSAAISSRISTKEMSRVLSVSSTAERAYKQYHSSRVEAHERKEKGADALENNLTTRLSSLFEKPRTSQFVADTGFANEEVPLNEEGFLVPLPWRLLLRSIVVCLATFIAAIMPFFGAFVSLVGSITFYPLSIYFPISCYSVVAADSLSKTKTKLLKVLLVVMAFVCASAFVASIRSIVQSFSTYSVFGM